MHQPKLMRPPSPRRLIALGRANQRHRAIFFHRHGVEPPFLEAYKSMHRSFGVVRLGAKPRKADRNSTANRQAVFPMRFVTYKDRLFGTHRLPRGHMRAM